MLIEVGLDNFLPQITQIIADKVYRLCANPRYLRELYSLKYQQ
jgi:hypothetical protein